MTLEAMAVLRPAEREFILTILVDGWWRTGEDTPRGIVGPLTNKGVLEASRYSDVGNVYRLTDLGLALRAHLLAQKDHTPS